MANDLHEPVLVEETLSRLLTDRNGAYLDATLGMGGHAETILEALSPQGRLLGVDADSRSLAMASERLGRFEGRFKGVAGNFKNAERFARESGFYPLQGALFDLGISSYQLDNPERGLSFQSEGPLDMRLSAEGKLTAEAIVNTWPEEQLIHLFKEYGEEPRAAAVARMIVRRREERPFLTTTELAEHISRVVPRSSIHPATRSFLALRIMVNAELENLTAAIEGILPALKKGGRLVVISFHSLEDRIVKRLFASFVSDGICRYPEPSWKKPLTPGETELARNPRSRSAKLRAVEKE